MQLFVCLCLVADNGSCYVYIIVIVCTKFSMYLFSLMASLVILKDRKNM